MTVFMISIAHGLEYSFHKVLRNANITVLCKSLNFITGTLLFLRFFWGRQKAAFTETKLLHASIVC